MSVAQLTLKMCKYCAGAEHCEWDVRNVLSRYEPSEEDIQLILAYLRKEKYLDDSRYCSAFVHDKVSYQGWGREKIRMALEQRRLPSECISQALDGIDMEEYYKILLDIIIKREAHVEDLEDFPAQAQIIQYCIQKGFLYDEIKEALRLRSESLPSK